ncbi:hypothetical protein M3Y98_01043500 [Aphelenchoides besseyi]|nr:hypothetical protein M3Y98_01043500 [Aphelenchoides besseyi]KAI6209851.1 hypothetical protein M3Y96_00264900 [Aphelenchoides besseyi]
MVKSFDGKAVIITGSSSGMGQQTAVSFAKAGSSVVVHGRNETGIKETVALIEKAGVSLKRVASVLGPLEDEKTLKSLVKTAIDKFGKIDILVNAAGIASKPNVPYDSMENFDFVMDVNLKAPIRLALLCVPHLEKTKGNIINISSIASVVTCPNMPFYSMSKSALENFTRNYAIILAPKQIRVNCLSPGLVRTGFQERMMPGKEGKQFIDAFEKTIPVGRSGTTQEMAAAIKFIAKTEFMNGEIIKLDGGSALQH